MPKRIDRLTAEQEAAMAAYADEWIARGLRCGPADRAAVEDGIRRCYELTGLPWHGNVVWVRSPIVVGFAGPIAASLLERRGAVRGAVGGAVGGAVDGAVDGAVREAVHGAVGGAVDGAVHGAVGGAVRGAVDGYWWYYIGGQSWSGWLAWRGFFRDICDLELADGMWDRHQAYTDANLAGWWWPHRQFVIVADRQTVLHLEQVGPRGWGSHRLHCATGPAIAWGDEWSLHYWHGVPVPADLLDGWDHKRILAEPNAEVRRCAIEVAGWDRFITEAGITCVDEADDPGNPGQRLQLYDIPEQVYDERVRLVLCTNGSPERDGTRRRFGLTVPADMPDVVTAAAWTYNLSRQEYAGLERRT